MTNPNRRLALIAAVALGTALAPAAARADDTIKRPGDHPHYSVELEPHLLLGLAADNYYGGTGFGLGGRVSINLTDNGFIKSINNSVAIGLGLDWVHYSAPSGCYYGYQGGCYGYGASADFLQFPVVMQWNFYVAEHWSVFGEPGLYIWHGSYGNGGCYAPNGAPMGCGYSDTGIGPAFWAGGRYHFNDTVTLIGRIGYPDLLTFGVSFML